MPATNLVTVGKNSFLAFGAKRIMNSGKNNSSLFGWQSFGAKKRLMKRQWRGWLIQQKQDYFGTLSLCSWLSSLTLLIFYLLSLSLSQAGTCSLSPFLFPISVLNLYLSFYLSISMPPSFSLSLCFNVSIFLSLIYGLNLFSYLLFQSFLVSSYPLYLSVSPLLFASVGNLFTFPFVFFCPLSLSPSLSRYVSSHSLFDQYLLPASNIE